LSSLVAFLEPRLHAEGSDAGPNQSILECNAEFVIDDNGELWLTSLPSVTVAPPGPVRGVEAPDELATSVAPDEDQTPAEGERGDDDSGSSGKAGPGPSVHMPPLLVGTTANAPQTAAPLDGSGSTPLDTSLRQQLGRPPEGELPTIPSTMLGARSSPGDHNSSSRGKLGQPGDLSAIFEKKGGVYVANLHASALRGLCCWREVRPQRQTNP